MALINQLPIINRDNFLSEKLYIRGLMLSALTKYYTELWKDCWSEKFTLDSWGKSDHRLSNHFFENLKPKWNRDFALRSPFTRRQALLELDVLSSLILGLSIDELKTIYRIQFPVLYQYESDTWYDQNGRIVFTASKGLPGVGFSRLEWNAIKYLESGTVERTIMDDTLPGGPRERTITYKAPFDRCDREKDYEECWNIFENRLKTT